jgi:hypothetical protein
MARMQIVVDGRWLSNLVWNLIFFLAVLLGGVYLAGGLWWTLAAGGLLTFVAGLLWRVIRG